MTNNIQIILPKEIYNIYVLFESNQEYLFKNFKNINGTINIRIARNLSNLNYYIIDILLNEQLNLKYLMDYIKNIDYRNHFAPKNIKFKVLNKINESHWREEENYSDNKNIFDVISLKNQLLFYTQPNNINKNTSQAKYYNSYKITKVNNKSLLRMEIVFNTLDIDQEIDINIYLIMIVNILRATYKLFNLPFDLDKKQTVNEINTIENLLMEEILKKTEK